MSSNPSQTGTSAVHAKAVLWRRVEPTTAHGPRFGILGSLAFHALVFSAALFSFRNFHAPQETHTVPVDLVTLADTTNVAAQAPPAPKLPEPEKIDIPTPTLEPPPEPELAEVAPAPDAKMPEFDVAKAKPPEKPKEEEKPKPPEKPKVSRKQQQQQDFAALLNKLTAQPRRPSNAKEGPRVIRGIGAGTAMTADLADALQSQIYRCWSPPVGAPNADDLIVDYDLRLNPDGTVAALALLPGSAAAASGNSYTRAAAEAASRAVYQCAPYRLPADRYSVWRDINPLHFDPRQLMQQ
jgi:outer membrane biosynthesis protein TonB